MLNATKPLTGAAALALTALAALSALAADPPLSARAIRAELPPVIDGLLTDPCWKAAPALDDFEVFAGKGRRVTDTAFRLVYDDTWLYIAVDCKNPKMPALQPIVRGHDKGACNDDAVEFFLDPDTGGKLYLHYMLNFSNARDERRVAAGNREINWDLPWRSATARRQDGWSAEAAIPLHALVAYGPLSKLKFNVTRTRRLPVIDANHVVITEDRELSTWAPMASSFHEPEHFRPLAGIPDDMKVAVPLLAQILSARVTPYYAKEGRTFYDVEVEVRGHTPRQGELQLVVQDRPATRPAGQVAQAVTLAGVAPRAARIAVPVDVPCSREVAVLLKDPATAEVLDTLLIADLAALNVMTAYLDRNYYTTEAEAAALCRIGMPADALKTMSIEARAADGRVLARLAAVRPDSRIAIPLADLPPGAHALDLLLREKDGTPFFKTPIALLKRAPKPDLEWKIDQERRVLLNNGTPFFPYGVVMSGVKADDLAAYKKLADNGFNTFLVWARTTPEGLADFQKNAAAHGLFVISHPDECAEKIEWDCHARYSGALLEQLKRVTATQSLNGVKAVMTLPVPIPERNAIYGEFFAKNIDRFIRGVDAVKSFPNLAAYFIMDEPMSAQQFDEYKFGQEYYARIHRADGYHPVIVNYSSFIPDGEQYTNWCDVLVTDPYWYPPATTLDVRSTPNHVSKISWMTDQRAQERRQASWQVLAGPRWSRCFKRALNQREIRAQTYLALIHKTTGIFFFSYAGARDAEWATFKQLGAELKLLTPFALGPQVPQQLLYRRSLLAKAGDAPAFADTPFNPLKEQYPDVQALLLADGAGNHILLAANSRHYPVACRFELPTLRKATPAFAGAPPAVRDGAFADTLEPYATRAWRVELAPDAAPRVLTLLQSVLKDDLTNPETVLPGAWRPGRKNAMPNPGFEEATAEGCPDYCRLSNGATLQEGGALFGKRCVRLTKATPAYEFLHMHCDPQDSRPQTYTLSVHLKADRDGLGAWLRGMQMNPEKRYGENADLKLTTEWRRYSITGVIPARVSEAIYEVRLREPGTIWIDGVQLERGDTPTEFEE
jgi:hypothetical protein